MRRPVCRSSFGRRYHTNSRYTMWISAASIQIGSEWVRARFSVAELKDGQVTKVVFRQYEY